MANDVYATAGDCRFCAQNRAHDKRQLELLFLEQPLEYIDMNIVGPLLERKQGSQFVIVMKDRYTKPAKMVLTTNTNATIVAPIVF